MVAEAGNVAIVAGLNPGGNRAKRQTEVADLGRARVPVVRSLQLAAEVEDDELIRRFL